MNFTGKRFWNAKTKGGDGSRYVCSPTLKQLQLPQASKSYNTLKNIVHFKIKPGSKIVPQYTFLPSLLPLL